jgi:dihydrofolate synthase/folylpolyglutamate synthase
MRFDTLEAWLAWQETLHPRAIELGLERCRAVAARLGLEVPPFPVLTVGGTNGKGSTVALLDAVLRAAGYRVGTYTSPHLLRYNERIQLAGVPVGDDELCATFDRVDGARGDTSLTYFEFGTLAALDLFGRAGLDAAVLEVGLGGRLDAVNLVDADVAVITSVGIDHTDWLGPDRESIGREKAGIFRADRPAVCGDRDPPASVLDAARALPCPLLRIGRDYEVVARGARWDFEGPGGPLRDLPHPALAGRAQLGNAATAVAALGAVAPRLRASRDAVAAGLTGVRLAGRLQVLEGPVPWVLDVAHNPQAVRELAAFLRVRGPVTGLTHALFGVLADKDLAGVIREAAGVVDRWHVVGLDGPRGCDPACVARALEAAGLGDRVTLYPSVEAGYRALRATVRPPDRVVAFGSFHTVAPVLRVETSPASQETLVHG